MPPPAPAQRPQPHESGNAGQRWLDAMRAGDFPAAWAVSGAVLAARDPATRDDPRLPYHRRWVWDGRDPTGRQVLVRCYHGLGDTLQFCRFLRTLRSRVAGLTLEVQPELLGLLRDLPGPDRLVPFDPDQPIPESECDVEIMELPHLLRTAPGSAPYLSAVPLPRLPPDRLTGIMGGNPEDPAPRHPCSSWPGLSRPSTPCRVDGTLAATAGSEPRGSRPGQQGAVPHGAALRHGVDGRDKPGHDGRPGATAVASAPMLVGVCWQAGGWDPGRSVPLAMLAPLAALPGVRLVSLQRGPGAMQAESPGAPPLLLAGDEDMDVARMARMLATVDLVVTVDTMVAHLAGALGRPAWVLLQAEADWRWMAGRTSSPWYPSLRLYRQTSPGDWHAPLAQVRNDLAAWGRNP